MLVDLYTKDGQTTGQIDLPNEIFAVEPNEHAMHTAVVIYLAHQRQGTRKTKVRHEVRGGGKKPWRQKGRGTARAGSTRSPLWVGGGTVFGPQPGKFTPKLPKKVSRLARRSALSLRLSENNIVVVEDFTLTEYKTKDIIEVLKNLNLEYENTLILLPESDEKLYISARNIPYLSVNQADKISTYDILNHKKLLLLKGAIDKIANTFAN